MRNKFLISIFILLSISFGQIFSQQNDFASGIKQLNDLQFQKAKSIFKALSIVDTLDCRAHFYLGWTYSFLHQYDSADYCLKKAISINPKNPYSLLGNGIISLRANASEKAVDLFKQAQKISKKDPVIFSLSVNACLNNPKPDTSLALSFLLEFEKVHSQKPDYFISKAKYDLAKAESGNAASDYEWAFYYDPQNTFAYTNLGKIFTEALMYKEALSALNRSIELDADQVMVYKYLGDLQYRFGKYPEAKKAYQKYLSVAEVSIENMEKYGIILFYNKEFQAASEEMQKVMLLDPNNPVMNRITAYVDYETGDFENGMKYIKRLFELKDTSKLIAPDYLYFGKLLLKTGNDSAGIVNIRKALALDDTKTDAYIDLAAVLSKNKKHDDAIAVYEKLITKGIDKSATYFRIGKEYYYKGVEHKVIYDSLVINKILITSENTGNNDSTIAIGFLEKADSFFTLVSKIAPEYYGGYLWSGRVLSLIDNNMEKGLAKGPYEKALSILEKDKLSQNKNSIIECYRYLGAYFYFESERYAETDKNLSATLIASAIESYDKIIQLNPSDTKTMEILDQLKNPPKPR